MSESQLIQETPYPRTFSTLAEDLRRVGVVTGMTLIVHSSLRALGWVSGGPVAAVQALMEVISPEGTLVMPTHTGGYSDPARWQNPPVPQSWWQSIYESMPAFDPQITPSSFMGQIAETFRTWSGVVRSNHPQVSFAAWGRHAHEVTANHSLDNGCGEGSPLARVYDLDGWVLLLGVGYDSCTSLHVAEHRAPGAIEIRQGAPILEHGQRVWKTFRDIEMDADIFPAIGQEFEKTGLVKIGKVGSAEVRLFPQRPAIDFATQWLTRTRQ